jgi:hypothetical protein
MEWITMKKLIILILAGLIFLVGYTKTLDCTGRPRIQSLLDTNMVAPDVDFDWNNTLRVIHCALGRTEQEAHDAAEVLWFAQIRGAVSAELYEYRRRMSVESEDGRVIRLNFGVMHGTFTKPEDEQRWEVSNVWDMDIDEEIWWRLTLAPACIPEFPEPEFDLERTVRVIQKAVGASDERARLSTEPSVFFQFPRTNVMGAIKAEVVDAPSGIRLALGQIVVRIETEDNKHYYLVLGRLYGVHSIYSIRTLEDRELPLEGERLTRDGRAIRQVLPAR